MVSSSGYVFLIILPVVTGSTLNCKSVTLILGNPIVVLIYVDLCELQKNSEVNIYCVLSGKDTESR